MRCGRSSAANAFLVHSEPRERVWWLQKFNVALPTLWEANSAAPNVSAELRSHFAAKERERNGRKRGKEKTKKQKEWEKITADGYCREKLCEEFSIRRHHRKLAKAVTWLQHE